MDNTQSWVGFIEDLFWKKLQKPSSMTKSDWRCMSSHPFLKKEMILKVPHGEWDWLSVSRAGWCPELVLTYPWKGWDWGYLSFHMPFPFIREHPYLPWDLRMIWRRFSKPSPPKPPLVRWSTISENYSLEFILKHHTFPWNWKQVSRNPSLTLGDVCHFHRYSWDLPYVMKNVNFSASDLKRTDRILLNFKLLSENPFCRPEIVRRFINRDWDWTKLAAHPAFPPHQVVSDPVLGAKWRWDRCLSNPRLTIGFYETLRRSVNIPKHFTQLSQNHFHKSVQLLPYHRSVLVRFFWWVYVKKRFRRKMDTLLQLKKNMDPVVLRYILFLYV